jgi:hypothetical protein
MDVAPILANVIMQTPRMQALAYARKFWNRVCDDGCIGGTFPGGANFRKVPLDTVFVNDGGQEHALLADGSRIEWAPLDDCTHYISCCLARGANIKVKNDFNPPPYGILGANRMVDWLTTTAKLATVIAVPDKTKPPIDKLSAGDLIGYKRGGRFGHLAMYLGEGKIACHTYCRSDDVACTWDNDFTIGRDDPAWSWAFLKVNYPMPASAPSPAP